MGNSYFQFKRFKVQQERCAMKVGTDGTLLGAWALLHPTATGDVHPRVLDIGTGTGVVALMMAQRYEKAEITAIDIDGGAVSQARENVVASPFAGRIEVVEGDIRNGEENGLREKRFNTIVSNPPYFRDSLKCPDSQRTVARHTTMLTFADLIRSVVQLLTDDGEFSLVIPSEGKADMEAEAAIAGLFKSRECAVKTTPSKPPRRYLMAFRKHPCKVEMTEGVIETAPKVRSPWYEELTKDFYL